MKKFGPLVVFSGIDPGTGLPNPKLWATPGAQLRKFDKGIHMALPPNLETPTHVHGWCLLFIGDMLALHKLLPFVETPSAYCPCRECNWDTRKPSAYEPVHFLRDGDACRWSVYSTASVEQELSRMRELGKTKAKPLMQDMGLNSLESALSPKFVPHFRIRRRDTTGANHPSKRSCPPPCPLICPPLPTPHPAHPVFHRGRCITRMTAFCAQRLTNSFICCSVSTVDPRFLIL